MNKLKHYIFLYSFTLQCSNQVLVQPQVFVQPVIDLKNIDPMAFSLLLASFDVRATDQVTRARTGMGLAAYLLWLKREDLVWLAFQKGCPIYPEEMIRLCASLNIDCRRFVTDPNAPLNSYNQNALHIAVSTGSCKTVNEVLSMGARTYDSRKFNPHFKVKSPLLLAFELGDYRIFRILLSHTEMDFDLLTTLANLRDDNVCKILLEEKPECLENLKSICWSHRWLPKCIFNKGGHV